MRHQIFLFLCLSLILTSCQGNLSTASSGGAQIESPGKQANQTSTTPSLTTEKTVAVPPTQVEVAMTLEPAGCTVVSPRPTPGPTEQSIFPPVGDLDWVIGPQEASITLVEYSDFQ